MFKNVALQSKSHEGTEKGSKIYYQYFCLEFDSNKVVKSSIEVGCFGGDFLWGAYRQRRSGSTYIHTDTHTQTDTLGPS